MRGAGRGQRVWGVGGGDREDMGCEGQGGDHRCECIAVSIGAMRDARCNESTTCVCVWQCVCVIVEGGDE